MGEDIINGNSTEGGRQPVVKSSYFQLRYFTAITTQIFLPLCIGPRKRLKYSAHHHLLNPATNWKEGFSQLDKLRQRRFLELFLLVVVQPLTITGLVLHFN